MKLSIVTIVFNAVDMIEKTIKSVVENSGFENIEYIIIDGCSTDGTMDVVRRYEEKVDILVSEKDNGIADAFNKGISYATGDLIGLINVGDCLEQGAYEALLKQFSVDVDVYYGDVKVIYENGMKCVQKPYPIDDIEKFLPFCHQASFVSKNAYEKYGKYDSEYRLCMDHELFLRMRIKGAKFQYISAPLAEYLEGGVSDKDYKKTMSEHIKVARLYGSKMLKVWCFHLWRLIKWHIKKVAKKMGFLTLIRKIRGKIKRQYEIVE